ncbi:hypothetical protein LSAT2_029689 [Lamellibrachia satsuma]|nr:hypothetical protein LSAT2_029689 [Lamellibrachia satsuma]
MRKFQKTLAAVVAVVLLYSAVSLLFVMYQHGLAKDTFLWQLSAAAPCGGRSCERLHDLSDDFPYSPEDGRSDMLHEMRACGVQPRLLTRAVARPNDTAYVVPNVVHLIRYTNNRTFDFQHYLCYRSVHRFIQPQYVFLHGDAIPEGEWWQQTLAEVDNLYHVYHERPTDVHGTPINFVQHSADITRLVVLIDYGGIYIDDDVLVIRSFDPLRGYDLTLGRPVKFALSNGIIIAPIDAITTGRQTTAYIFTSRRITTYRDCRNN